MMPALTPRPGTLSDPRWAPRILAPDRDHYSRSQSTPQRHAVAADHSGPPAQFHYGGGWRYLPGQSGDTNVTAWQLAAPMSAALGTKLRDATDRDLSKTPLRQQAVVLPLGPSAAGATRFALDLADIDSAISL